MNIALFTLDRLRKKCHSVRVIVCVFTAVVIIIPLSVQPRCQDFSPKKPTAAYSRVEKTFKTSAHVFHLSSDA